MFNAWSTVMNMSNTEAPPTNPEVSKGIRTTDRTWNRFKAFAASQGLTGEQALKRLLDAGEVEAEFLDLIEGSKTVFGENVNHVWVRFKRDAAKHGRSTREHLASLMSRPEVDL